jgi:stage V sporulation protein R
VLLNEADTQSVMQSLANLWGYDVCLDELDGETRSQLKQHRFEPQPVLRD